LLAQVPPQSTSLSVPFFTLSVQTGAAHLVAVQTPLMQSPAPPQEALVLHFVAQVPPQSLSVSLPFFTPSMQLGVWHLRAVEPAPAAQTCDWQSAPPAQLSPSSQGAQAPPQSTSVSLLFFTPSMQLGAWHLVPVHTPD